MQTEFKIIIVLLIVALLLLFDARLHISDCLVENLTVAARATQRNGIPHLDRQLYGKVMTD